ncbi:MAG: HAMP domain-containing sensor histidine kinase, partial [Bacteroidota bacterium]
QKLIRVLTHEIMNSIAPITSLSDSLLRLLKMQAQHVEDLKLPEQLNSGLEAIKSRSDGLMKFTRDYRELTRIPLPKMREVGGNTFFQDVKNLFSATLDDHITLSLSLPATNFSLEVDPDLMSQVMINLLKNAREAIESGPAESGAIEIVVTNGHSTVITISDNGPGMTREVEDKMFVPFFTSKTNGSGIGLSLVKQIVQLHRGKISAARVDHRTVFSIEI